MSRYETAHFEQIEQMDDGRCPFRMVRHHFGITAFGVNTFTGRAVGDRIINEHDEAGENEELYVVLQGRATFELDGERVDAPTGTFVFAEPGVKRTAFAAEPETTLLAVGATPGHAYEPYGFELWAPFQRLYNEGDYAAAADQARGPIEADTRYALPLFNLACCEARAGRTGDAIEHLRTALGRSERVRAWAENDTDLDSLRDEPAFKELMAG